MSLQHYITEHTDRNGCRCRTCFAPGEAKSLPEHTANMVFFDVAAKNNPTPEEMAKAISEHRGENASALNLLDGEEHSYKEVGAWVGDQQLALQLIGLGALLKLWEIQTPYTEFGDDLPQELALMMATRGLLFMKAKAQKERAPVPEAKHGEERNRHDETEYGKPIKLVNLSTGATVFSGVGSSHTRTVIEKYCEGCSAWIEVRGVFGMLSWIAEHDGHQLTTDVLQ